MELRVACGDASQQSGEPAMGTVREAALERHHQLGIPFWAPGKKDSHRMRCPTAAHDGGRWTLWRKRWSDGCEGWSGRRGRWSLHDAGGVVCQAGERPEEADNGDAPGGGRGSLKRTPWQRCFDAAMKLAQRGGGWCAQHPGRSARPTGFGLPWHTTR
jgi:hypothetical protein